jgi:hypothetical protein
MCGKGKPGERGASHTSGAIVTRWHPDKQDVLQMLAIKREEGDWTIPDGIVAAKQAFVDVQEEAIFFTADQINKVFSDGNKVEHQGQL